MTVYWALWEFSVNCVEIAALFYLLRSRLGFRDGQHLRAWAGYAAMVGTITSLNLLNAGTSSTMILFLLVQAAWVFLCFGGSMANRLFWFAACTAVPYVTSTILTIYLTLVPLNLQETLLPSQSRMVTQIFYLAITFLQCTVLAKLPRGNEPQASAATKWGLTSVLILAYACLAVNIGMLNDPQLSGTAANGLVLDSLGFLVVSVGVVILFNRLSCIIQQQMELTHALELQALHEKERQRASAALKTWRHDIRRALEPLSVLAAAGNLDGIRDYLRDLDLSVDAFGTGVSTGSAALDAVLITRKARAQSVGTPMQITAEQTDFHAVSSSLLSIAVSNLLDNCIEASTQVPLSERFVDVRVRRVASMVEIDVINSANGHYLTADQNLLSTKSGGDHGHGYDQLRKLTEQTGGYYLTDALQDSYRVRVYLPVDPKRIEEDANAQNSAD